VDRHATNRIRRLEAEIFRLRREVRELSAFKRMAYHDDLTGLRNRRYFEERLGEELARSERSRLPCSVIVVDIDDFKVINDQHGHAAGDALLRSVGAMLSSNARAADIACRVGGDEMAIILPMTDAVGAASARARFEAAQGSIVRPDGRTLSLSIGTGTYPDDAHSMEALLDRADRAMYVAKRKRKNSDVAA
jgi:diguanylate cyclase (GGDEF)-like protein